MGDNTREGVDLEEASKLVEEVFVMAGRKNQD